MSTINSDYSYKVGTRVLAKIDGWSKSYPGVIRSLVEGGKYSVEFDDGDVRNNVAEKDIELEAADKDTGHAGSKPAIGVNDIVKCKFRGKSQWYNAQVKAVHADGTCDIVYLDDKTEDHRVPPERIKFLRKGTSLATAPTKPELSQLVLESRVDATHPEWMDENGENPRYYPAAVVKMRNIYTYDVEFFDGDEMHGLAIPRENIRPVTPLKGSFVRARLDRWKKHYYGIVKHESGKQGESGVIGVQFTDGEEQDVKKHNAHVIIPSQLSYIVPKKESRDMQDVPFQDRGRIALSWIGKTASTTIARVDSDHTLFAAFGKEPNSSGHGFHGQVSLFLVSYTVDPPVIKEVWTDESHTK